MAKKAGSKRGRKPKAAATTEKTNGVASGNGSQASMVRAYVAENPNAKPKQILEALGGSGVKIHTINNTLSKLRKAGGVSGGKKRGRKKGSGLGINRGRKAASGSVGNGVIGAAVALLKATNNDPIKAREALSLVESVVAAL